MSEEYFKACTPTVYFIETPQTVVPSKFDSLPSAHYYHETVLDTADCSIVEREF